MNAILGEQVLNEWALKWSQL